MVLFWCWNGPGMLLFWSWNGKTLEEVDQACVVLYVDGQNIILRPTKHHRASFQL